MTILSATFFMSSLVMWGVLAYDFVNWLNRRYGIIKYRIFKGDGYAEAVTSFGKELLRRHPRISSVDERRLILLDEIREAIRVNDAIQGWQYAPLYAAFGQSSNRFSEVDDGFGAYLCWIDDNRLPGADEFVEFILSNRTISFDGSRVLVYRKNCEQVFVDTLAFLCPFLMKHARITMDKKLSEFVVQQLLLSSKFGFVETLGLVAHSWDIEKKMPCAGIGWGRGAGWWIFALLFSFKECGIEELRTSLRPLLEKSLNSILCLQMSDGGWCSDIVSHHKYDSGATALLGYCMVCAYRVFGNSTYFNAAVRAVTKLKHTTSNSGAVMSCEGDSHGPGRYSRRYSSSPFSQGLTILLVREISNGR